VLRASFWLAPCWFHHRALQPDGGQDAKCVRPTSATHAKNCVHPHLVRSRFAPPLSRRGRLTDFGIRAACPGDQAFHDASIRFGGTSSDTLLEPRVLSVTGGGSRAWALSSHGAGSTEPLTSLSPLPLPVCVHAPSGVLGSRGRLPAVSAREKVARGSDEEEAAKTAVTIEP